MIIERPGEFESYGRLRIYRPVKVLELDGTGADSDPNTLVYSHAMLADTALRTAIVVPVKDEELIKLRGVVQAIPHPSTVIVVSASRREPTDVYRDEVDMLSEIHRRTGKRIIATWQRDPAWGEALKGTPLEPLLGEDGLVRYGKGEGMLLGALLAYSMGLDYLGFIDSDNFSPGSVLEYSLTYYAGFLAVESELSMVRLKWPYKGKLESSEIPYLRKRGRVSTVTNEYLNTAISRRRGLETIIVETANSGEHALTTKLAVRMPWAGGYAVEPYQLVSLLERCWLSLEPPCDDLEGTVEVLQVETLSPHIHSERGEEHIAKMIGVSLASIYWSKLATEDLREAIKEKVTEAGLQDVPSMMIYPPPGETWPARIVKAFESNSELYTVLG